MVAEWEQCAAARDADQLSEPVRAKALQQQLDGLRAQQDPWKTQGLDTLLSLLIAYYSFIPTLSDY